MWRGEGARQRADRAARPGDGTTDRRHGDEEVVNELGRITVGCVKLDNPKKEEKTATATHETKTAKLTVYQTYNYVKAVIGKK